MLRPVARDLSSGLPVAQAALRLPADSSLLQITLVSGVAGI